MIKVTAFLLFLGLAQQAAAQGDPLFLTDEPLELVIEMPMKVIINDAEKRPVVEGMVRVRDNRGSRVSIDMTMTTRGHSRLEYCRFPPLKLNLKKGQTAGTVFEGQNKLKIVTHCRDGDVHSRYLRQEFGIYKAYNELTPFAFRARWINITYKDSEKKRDDQTHDAFFIESGRELEERLGRQRVELNQIPSERLKAAESSIYALFQYLIGNTDWSMLKGPGEEGCCHNGKVLQVKDSTEDWVVIPYDFDQAGLIHTKYSMPADGLRIRSVRQRLYRGRCRHNDQLESTIALFNERRSQLQPHLVPESIDGRSRRRSQTYFDAFFEIINDPKQKQRRLLNACLGA